MSPVIGTELFIPGNSSANQANYVFIRTNFEHGVHTENIIFQRFENRMMRGNYFTQNIKIMFKSALQEEEQQ